MAVCELFYHCVLGMFSSFFLLKRTRPHRFVISRSSDLRLPGSSNALIHLRRGIRLRLGLNFGKRVSVLLPAPHLSPVVPIYSYVDDSNAPSAIFGLLTLTLAVVGVGSGGDSDNRDKTNLFRCQNRWRIDISNPSCSRGVTCRVTVTTAKWLKESLGCAELARIEERRCVLCTVDQSPRHC